MVFHWGFQFYLACRRQNSEYYGNLEIKHFVECIEACELYKMRSSGLHFSQTNNTTWSRIDWALSNTYQQGTFDFLQVTYMPQSLSDHTPLLMGFPSCHKPTSTFMFHDMQMKCLEFDDIVKFRYQVLPDTNKLQIFSADLEPLLSS